MLMWCIQISSWIAGPSISLRGTDGRGTDRIRDASEYIYSTLRSLPGSGKPTAVRWRMLDQYILAWFLGNTGSETSPLKQLSYQIEWRARLQPSTLGPFHVAVFNRIRKATGGQKISDLKPFMPKVLNVIESTSSGKSKKGSQSKTKRTDGAITPLAAFLKEVGVKQKEWDEVKGAMTAMAGGKINRLSRQVGAGDTSLSAKACVYWTRSRDILGGERVSSNSDKLTALAYTFVISHFTHRPMIEPGLANNNKWMWEAWQCRSCFQDNMCTLFKSSDSGDWLWADHITLPATVYKREAELPYLQSFYEKQMQTFGAETLVHIEKLNATAKAIVAAAGRFQLKAVPEDVQANITTLTNEFVEVCGVHIFLN